MVLETEQRAEKKEAKKLAFRSSWKQTLLELAILGASGILLATAFPGVNWDVYAWIAFVPVFWIIRNKSTLRAGMYGLFFGYVWNLGTCFWLREIEVFIPFIFALILGAFTAFWALLVPAFCRTLLYPPSVRLEGSEAMKSYYKFHPGSELLCAFSLAAWWVCLEWIRSWIFTGFPWNLLSTTQWQNLSLIQICEYTGIYGVSFLVIFINIALFFAVFGLKNSLSKGKYKRPFPLLLGLTIVLLCAMFGRMRMNDYEMRRGDYNPSNTRTLSVGVIQPDLTQRRQPLPGQFEEALEKCMSLSLGLLRDSQVQRMNAVNELLKKAEKDASQDTDVYRSVPPLSLLIWPETAVPGAYRGGGWEAELYRQKVRQLLKTYKVPLLLGTTDFEIRSQDDFDYLNSALLLLPDRNQHDEVDARYSKVHIVPFGEFVPLGDKFPALRKFIGMNRDLTRGPGFFPIEVAPNARAGVLICYEDVFPYISRAHALAGANFLLVITNDAWYPTSFEPDQHYANSIFRTIETRLPMVRCGNSNYSVLVDPAGRTLNSIFTRYDEKKGRNVLMPELKQAGAEKFTFELPIEHTPTFYMLYGNIFVLICWIVFGAGALTALFRWKKVADGILKPLEDKKEELRASMRNFQSANDNAE